MTKELIISNITKALQGSPKIIYAYIGGSFNTPFKTDHSDVDLMLIWQDMPSLQDRNEILKRLEETTSFAKEWSFFDAESAIARDAIKIQNLPKIEIYHHSFEAFEYILKNLLHEDGLVYSLSNRFVLIDQPAIETFIDSYLPSLATTRQDLLFAIMADHQENNMSERTFENIVKLYSINKFDGVPAVKHWNKIIEAIPEYRLLLDGHYSEWMALSLELLLAWGNTAPEFQLIAESDILLSKHDSTTTLEVFQKVAKQKERLRMHLSWPKHINTPDDQEAFARKADTQWNQGQAFHFQIFQQENFAGAISIHTLNYQDRSFEFGYWVDVASEGKGLISKGLKMLLKEMKIKGWRKAQIRTTPQNIKSQNVAQRSGMTLEVASGPFLIYSYE